MDPQRFDALVRSLGGRSSRRTTIRRLGLGAVAAALAGRSAERPVAARRACTYIGCACSTGTYQPCGADLVCCPLNRGTPGGAGVGSAPGDCGGGCRDSGQACTGSCNWGDACPGCCSGYCGQFGQCADATCNGLGCACASGTFQPCNPGLVCCSSYPGMPGAQGTCQYGC
ncbi:MAG TPA: hypothetical protein VFX03_14940 [Thermomicrobiales bacterium]|nr:hypothetical protein [Thermomicrobiales bacterium]